jgi:hypothetical protein
LIRFNRLDWELQVTRIKAATGGTTGRRSLSSSTGAGEPVFENLRKAGLHVRPYGFHREEQE